jgi:hypothetical protein
MSCKIEVDKIVGYVYPIKEQLKEAGARWNAIGKFWYVNKETDIVKVSSILEEFNNKNESMYSKCDECGAKCKKPYKLCVKCKEK